MAKMHPDSLAAKLTPDQREELLTALILRGKSLADGVEICRGWGVRTTDSSVSRFHATFAFPFQLELAAQAAAEVGAECHDEARKRIVEQKAFEMAARAGTEDATILKLREQEIKLRAIALQERRLELLEARETAAKAALQLPALTPEERTARLYDIFGITAPERDAQDTPGGAA